MSTVVFDNTDDAVDAVVVRQKPLDGSTDNAALVAIQGSSSGRGPALLAVSRGSEAPAVRVKGAGPLVQLADDSGSTVLEIGNDGAFSALAVDGNLTVDGVLGVGVTPSTRKLDVDSTGQSAYIKSTAASNGQHALTTYQAAVTGDNSVALNVVSDNPEASAMYISGPNTQRSTLKITHTGQAGGTDSSASAIGIDLTVAGTAANGLSIIPTNATTGNLIQVRNNGREDFTVKGTGRVGIGVATAATPSGMVDIRPYDASTRGLFIQAFSGGTDMIQLRDSAGNTVLQVTAAGVLVLGGDVNLFRQAADRLATNDRLESVRAASTDECFAAFVTGDSVTRIVVDAAGKISWSAGSGSKDTNLYRSAADTLKTDDKLIAVAGLGVGNAASATVAVGTLSNKIEVFDASGASLGFVPVYASIT